MFWLPFLNPYWSRFWANLKPILGPKTGPKFVNFWVQFWISFVGGFGGLWVPLGGLLGPLEALLGGLKSEKMQTVQRENHFFENVAFLVFEALDGPLGLMLPSLWPIWSENGSQNGPQKGSKKWPKSEPKNDPKNTKKVQILGVQHGSMLTKNRSYRSDLGNVSSWTGQLEIQVPRWPQRQPKIASNSLR